MSSVETLIGQKDQLRAANLQRDWPISPREGIVCIIVISNNHALHGVLCTQS